MLTAGTVKDLVSPASSPAPEIQIPAVDLLSYDRLLEEVAS